MEFVYVEDQIEKIAAEILTSVNNKTLLFYGPMGAGKTTLIKAMVKVLGGAQQGSSPTFGIVNEYSNGDGALLGYHFDFYRLEHEYEALDIGLEEYLSQDTWVFIEWPEKAASYLPPAAVALQIDIIDAKTRKITFSSEDN